MQKKKKPINYKALFTKERDIERDVVLRACPNMRHQAGIYFYTMETEEDGKRAYIGKSLDCVKRTISHIMGYDQAIDLSLKKRGFYSPENTMGWKLNVLYFQPQKLDEMEQKYIKAYQDAGYEMLNIESGGTDGKTIIGERKAGKNYHDGLKQGRKAVQKEIKHLFDLHLDYSIRGKETVNKRKAYDKFTQFLGGDQSETDSQIGREGENDE